MNDDQIMDVVIKLSTGIAELNANMRTTLDKLAQHESRITVLERDGRDGRGSSSGSGLNGDWKEQLLMLLAKAILIGAVSMGSLVGAGSLMKNLIGGNNGSNGSNGNNGSVESVAVSTSSTSSPTTE